MSIVGIYRINKICIPHLHGAGKGHIIWISSSSAHSGVPPHFGPYFVAKAATDSLAVTYATELAPWRIKTTIMVPGVFMKGRNHLRMLESWKMEELRLIIWMDHYKGCLSKL